MTSWHTAYAQAVDALRRRADKPEPIKPIPPPGVDLAPAPMAPMDALCGFCDVPRGVHGVRYSALPGWHTWHRSTRFPRPLRFQETPHD